ncbi:hypothetical protein ACLOJK_029939 [Asimina triloba]
MALASGRDARWSCLVREDADGNGFGREMPWDGRWNADGVLDWVISRSLPSDLDLEGKSSFCNSLWRMDHLGMLLDGGEMEMGGGLDGCAGS